VITVRSRGADKTVQMCIAHHQCIAYGSVIFINTQTITTPS